jgi:tRNA threonylcarbamoyladenosine biosynthesis protein TsaE
VRDPVCSPTFTLANEHAGRRGARFLHLDLYRLEDEDAVAAFGFEELLEGAALAAVEWPERAGTLLPERTIHVWMAETAAPEARRLRVTFSGGGLPETEWSRLAGIAGVQRI